MSHPQTQHFFYTVELTALEEHLTNSMDRVTRLREKAVKRHDLQTADQINQLLQTISTAQNQLVQLK